MNLSFKIGHRVQTVEVETNPLYILEPNPASASPMDTKALSAALTHPIGTPPLGDIVHRGETVAIVTSDITRPMPSWQVIPLILDELYRAGVAPRDITLIFALGSHRKHTWEEMRHLAGEQAWREVRCADAGEEGYIYMGTTSRNTPVNIDRLVAQADRRICLGNIEYHYFAGYSGGAKAIMPGVSSRASIQANHSHMVSPAAQAGILDGNPVREDIEEAAAMVGIDFIFNVILDPQKEIVHAVAGHAVQAHRAGCAFLRSLYGSPIERRADIVLVSQGGSPKDLNLYQTQKALANAKYAVKPGGIIILIGACNEGLGEPTFAQWLTQAPTPHSLVKRLEREFCLGGHKAAALAMVLEQAEIYLVSDLDAALVRSLFMRPFHCVQEAYDAARQKCGPNASVIAMPCGGSTLPIYMET